MRVERIYRILFSGMNWGDKGQLDFNLLLTGSGPFDYPTMGNLAAGNSMIEESLM